MRVPGHRERQRHTERSSLQILEEAFHLLRSVDVKYFLILFLGTTTFAGGLLFFIADMSRSGLARETVIPSSLGVTALYFWMRYCQVKFCEGLWKTINYGSSASILGTLQFRNLSALLLIQALHIPLMLAGLLFVIPLGWIIATLQNSTVLAFTKDFGRRSFRGLLKSSLRNSHYEWGQNHGILVVLLFVSLFVWLNVIGTCLGLATFGKAFFGIESAFTLSPLAALLNSTFLVGTFLLTYLVISPVMKAVYVLRCFYAESRVTGEDLLSRLASCRAIRKRSPRELSMRDKTSQAVMIAVIFCCLSGWVGALSADENPPSRAFESELSETFKQKKYQWQLSRRADAEFAGSEEGWLARRMRELAEATQELLRSINQWFDEMLENTRRDAVGASGGSSSDGLKGFEGLKSTFSLGLIAVVVGLILWLAFLLYRKYKDTSGNEKLENAPAAVVDLQNEDIVASQLPEGEWMRLAREQISKGDGRLAIRALFLATLANLGEEGVIMIARFKSNRDYRRELELKIRKKTELRTAFGENTKLFEEAWYGWHPVEEETVKNFLKNHEIIAKESGSAVASLTVLPEVAVS